MATALKHKQRSSRKYQNDHRVIGNIADSFDKKNTTTSAMKQSQKSFKELMKQFAGKLMKGDK